VHERHRSPYASPSRSLWRSSKCPRDKRLGLARRLIWTRAKHRVALERPHFCTRFRAQSDAWGRSNPTQICFGVLPGYVAGFYGNQVKEEGHSSEVGKNYPLHFQNCHFFTRRAEYRIRFQLFTTTTAAKVTAQERSNRAGATPLFGGRSAQKFGRVAPALAGTSRHAYCAVALGSPENLSDNMSDILYERERRSRCPF
jgi:hypothetical protein